MAGWNCRLIVVGFAGGEIEFVAITSRSCPGSTLTPEGARRKVPTNLLLLKQIAISGVHWGAYSKNELESIGLVWGSLLELIRQGRLRPAVFDRVYEGLDDLTTGLTDLSTRKTWGKAVLRLRRDGSGAKGSSGGGGAGAKREAKL